MVKKINKSYMQQQSTGLDNMSGHVVLVEGFTSKIKKYSVKSLICSFVGLKDWHLKPNGSDDEKLTLEVSFDTLQNAQAFSYKFRNRKWKELSLTSRIVGSHRSDVQSELKSIVTATRNNHQSKARILASTKSGRVIVRNLHWRIDEQRLKKLFASVATVTEVHMPTKDGRKRGFAFVQFQSRKDAQLAVAKMQSVELKGRQIAVDLAVPKDVHRSLANKNESQEENDDAEGAGDALLTDDEADVDDDDLDEADGKEDGGSECSDMDEEDVYRDDGDSDAEQDSSQEDDGDSMPHPQKKRKLESDVGEGKTVFVRNLPYTMEDQALSDQFKRFGQIEVAKVVLDKETDEPKGTGFVKFKDQTSVEKCLEKLNSKAGLVVERRKLSGELALSRVDAKKKKNSKKSSLDTINDKRNLHLARIGIIRGSHLLALSKHDIKLRDRIEVTKKRKLTSSNVIISKTRLCVHNVPKSVDDKTLRKLFLKAAGGTPNGAHISECRLMREKTDRTASGLGKSLGFGFVQFSTHQHALKALNAINNNPSVFSKDKRPIVEFSLENMSALQTRERRALKSKTALELRQKGESSESQPFEMKDRLSELSRKSETLQYRSKKKLKKDFKTPRVEKIVNEGGTNKLDLPKPVKEGLSGTQLQSMMKNPMPKKSAAKSFSKGDRINSKRLMKEQKAKTNNAKLSGAVEKKKKQRPSKFMKEPLRDELDALIESYSKRSGWQT